MEPEFSVTIEERDLRIWVAAHQTALQALRAAGVRVPSMCESGWCGTCELTVTAGLEDVIHRDVVYAAAERGSGAEGAGCLSMFPCVSRARPGANVTILPPRTGTSGRATERNV